MTTFVVVTLPAFLSVHCDNKVIGSVPNVVFILIDDMGWPDPGCYGHQFHETPVIDQLSRQGVRFTDFYAATPVCSSTRGTIQTGQYSARVGITDFIPGHWRPFEKLIVPPIESELPRQLTTVGSALQEAGYATGYFGKWHLGRAPDAYGYATTERQLGAEFQQWRVEHGTSKRRSSEPNTSELRATKLGLLEPGPKQIDLLTDQALYFIEQNRQRPFFVTLSHYAVHIRVESRPETLAKYEQKPKPAQGVNNPHYAAMIEDLDTSLGRLLKRLDALQLAENTIVVFTSDNGGLQKTFTGQGETVSTNAPLRDEKGSLYEGGVRVPLIVRWPGIAPAGTVCHQMATTADLLPTFCQLAQAKLPEQPIDGVSLAPLFRKPDGRLPRDAIYFHYPHYHHSRPAGAIRVGNWKLIEFFDDATVELYNLDEDLSETRNLAAEKPSLARQLQQRLASWRKEAGARMPTENPDYDPMRAGEWGNRKAKRPRDGRQPKSRAATK